MGYQRETRKRSRSPVGWASLFSHSSTLARHSEVDGVNWADGTEATQQDVAHAFKRDPVIPYFPRRLASTEPSASFVGVVAATAAERELRSLSANVLISEFDSGAFYMTGLACSMPAFPSKFRVRIHRDEPGMWQPWTPEPTGLWGGVRLSHLTKGNPGSAKSLSIARTPSNSSWSLDSVAMRA